MGQKGVSRKESCSASSVAYSLSVTAFNAAWWKKKDVVQCFFLFQTIFHCYSRVI